MVFFWAEDRRKQICGIYFKVMMFLLSFSVYVKEWCLASEVKTI